MTAAPQTAFIGMTHLGLVVSIGWADLSGDQILCLDQDERLLTKLEQGILPISEPGLSELLKKNKRNIFYSEDFSLIKSVSCVFFVVDTAVDRTGSTKELSRLISSALPYLRNDATVIIMSQVPVGFCRSMRKKIAKAQPRLSISLYYWVNTIVIGTALDRFLRPERIIIGKEDVHKPLSLTLSHLLKSFSCPILAMSYESAEMTKSAVNLFLAASITAANTLADLCEVSGADIGEIIPALRLDERIGPKAYVNPTIRIAGGHLERELFRLQRLAKQHTISTALVDCILQLNETRYRWALQKIKQYVLVKNSRPTICVWGLAYKKHTNATDNAASLKIIQKLIKSASLRVYDSQATLPEALSKAVTYSDKFAALDRADCLLILTDWEEFSTTESINLLRQIKGLVIIDGVGALRFHRAEFTKGHYFTMGVSAELSLATL